MPGRSSPPHRVASLSGFMLATLGKRHLFSLVPMLFLLVGRHILRFGAPPNQVFLLLGINLLLVERVRFLVV